MNNYSHDPLYLIDRCERDIPLLHTSYMKTLSGVNSVWQGYNAMPIPYSKEVASMVNKEACRAFASDDPLSYICSDQVTQITGNECKRWICALEAYMTSYKPLIPLKVLLEGVFDLDFAERLAKTRRHAWTRSYSMVPSEDDGDRFI